MMRSLMRGWDRLGDIGIFLTERIMRLCVTLELWLSCEIRETVTGEELRRIGEIWWICSILTFGNNR